MSVSVSGPGHGGNFSNSNNRNMGSQSQEYYQLYGSSSSSSSISEIEEEGAQNDDVPREIQELFEIKRFAPMPSIREEQYEKCSLKSNGEECVYVAVGKSASSMDALDWTLKNVVTPSPSTLVYLIHIFPEIRQIPTPCK